MASIVLLCALLVSCGDDENSDLTIPRGASISVTLRETLDSETSEPGDGFRAVLSTPLRQGLTTYVPLDAAVEGIVEESLVTNGVDPRARLSLRLTQLGLPNGDAVALDTVPLVRESGFQYRSAEVDVTTGLDVDLDHLLGRTPAGGSGEPNEEPRIRIVRDVPLVFTLRENITIAFPEEGEAVARSQPRSTAEQALNAPVTPAEVTPVTPAEVTPVTPPEATPVTEAAPAEQISRVGEEERGAVVSDSEPAAPTISATATPRPVAVREPEVTQPSCYGVQVGAFGSTENADTLQKRLSAQLDGVPVVVRARERPALLHIVVVGCESTPNRGQALREKLAGIEIEGFVVEVE